MDFTYVPTWSGMAYVAFINRCRSRMIGRWSHFEPFMEARSWMIAGRQLYRRLRSAALAPENPSSRRLSIAASRSACRVASLRRLRARIFREDLDEGYVTVLVEMMAGATSTPGLGEEVAKRIEPWFQFATEAIDRQLAQSPLASVLSVEDAAYAVVAVCIGLELLSHLEGDRSRALSVFERVRSLIGLFGGDVATPRAT